VVFVFDDTTVVCTDDQSYPDVVNEDQRKTGSPNNSTHYIASLITDFRYFSALACCTGYLPFLHYHIFGIQKQDCMNYSVQIKVMPLKELLDPQGKAVMGGLQSLGIKTIQDVRIGKNIQLQIEAATPDEAKKIAENASTKLLANPVMEYFEITIH
jgi:phosphoribosylformylglycinamidine synthase PurS subunit